MSAAAPERQLTFSSPNGNALVRSVTKHVYSYPLHDYQVEGICKLLDGHDLIALLPTGAGKSVYFSGFMIMLKHLAALHRFASLKIPTDPCMIVVYPTNGLEEEQARAIAFGKLGLSTVIINATTTSCARRAGRDLWVSARTGVSMVLLSPEQLTTPGFETLLQDTTFKTRLSCLAIDEIHLLYSWGLQFRQAFRQVGYTRARMPSHTRLVRTTATLLAGHPQETVLTFLGLKSQQFHLIRRSNLRRNVRTIFRTLSHGLGGWMFPDVKWVLADGRKTVIHCRTITLGFRLFIYLWHLCPPSPDRATRIRLYNALNWPSYNTETRRLMREDPRAQIVIATSTFMVGIDVPNIADE